MIQPRVTPQVAWETMIAGNERFVQSTSVHPHQDAARRDKLTQGQYPDVALFGCSDSRLAAEIIFDRGLGDLFVIRNIGHIVAKSIIASLEFAVYNLGSALIIVLAHDSCGAVRAAVNLSTQNPAEIPATVKKTLEPVMPAVQQVWLREHSETPYVDPKNIDVNEAGKRHLILTVGEILRESQILRDAVAAGKLGIVGGYYCLSEGRVSPLTAVGPLNIPGLSSTEQLQPIMKI